MPARPLDEVESNQKELTVDMSQDIAPDCARSPFAGMGSFPIDRVFGVRGELKWPDEGVKQPRAHSNGMWPGCSPVFANNCSSRPSLLHKRSQSGKDGACPLAK